MTLCAVLPSSSPAMSLRPREPITMTSAPISRAWLTISRAAKPKIVFLTCGCRLTPAPCETAEAEVAVHDHTADRIARVVSAFPAPHSCLLLGARISRLS
jgi:hypothetical protein